MTTSWASRINSCPSSQLHEKSIKIKSIASKRYDPFNKQSRKTHDRIPLSVRYERDPASDDDMIISNGEPTHIYDTNLSFSQPSNYDERKSNQQQQSKPIHLPYPFILKSFDENFGLILFNFIRQYIDPKTKVSFMKCCAKYTNIFGDIEDKYNPHLFKFWRSLRLKYYGKVYFRSCIKLRVYKFLPKSQKLQLFERQRETYGFWQDAYNRASRINRNIPRQIRYDHKKQSFFEYIPNNNKQESEICPGSLTIATQHYCTQADLLKPENFSNSNWYRRECKNPWADWGERVYKFELLMNNLNTDNYYVDTYLFRPSYEEHYGYLLELTPAEESGFEDYTQRRECKLSVNEKLKYRLGHGFVVREWDGVILNELVNIKTLELEVLKNTKRVINKRSIRVLVYSMRFGRETLKIVMEYGDNLSSDF